jgi:integrase/recombinase XerD
VARRRRQKPPPHPADDRSDPHGFGVMLLRFLEALAIRKHTEQTRRAHYYQLRTFIAWAAGRDLTRPQNITRAHVEAYQRHLHQYRKRNGEPLAIGSQCSALSSLRAFFRWLTKHHWILFNPASEIELPRTGKPLPRGTLSIAQAETVFAQVDLKGPFGIRDRALLETLYSTAIRRTELTRITLDDLDTARGTLRIREGKGMKDRVVPIGERAIAWIEKYVAEQRPKLLALEAPAARLPRRPGSLPAAEPKELFIGRDAKALSPAAVEARVEKFLKKAGFRDHGCCHLFRHTAATLMLEGGADIRYIQAMLGHEDLSTTDIYTRVSIQKLKAIHTATHPAAELPAAAPKPRGANHE